MVRRYAEQIWVEAELRLVPDSPAGLCWTDGSQPPLEGTVGGTGGLGAMAGPVLRPHSFFWRGRRYLVRSVLAQWRERRAWWREALDPVPGAPRGIAAAAREQLVWRVEASAGRSRATGVYDLACDEPDPVADATGATTPSASTRWRLVRVAD